MDYNKLAELLYPEVKKTVQDYEKEYPRRDLPAGAEVTRVAPSPTGYLHLGTVYQAMLDKKISSDSNGVFYLRLEDTDKKREIENAGTIAYEMLTHYNQTPDEGYRGDHNSETGNYGPYIQSERMNIYKAYAKYLVSIGKAFPCFCEKTEDFSEIEEKRAMLIEKNQSLENKDICRDLSLEEIEELLKQGKHYAIRLRSCGNENNIIKHSDLIKGEREIRENEKDIILLKRNGLPPYAFAHAVDDHLMGTTTVVRGEEWYASLSAHLELFEAFGFQKVKYAHTPVICKLDEEGNKRKLSKRKDPEADARYFIEKGYPVGAVTEYLLNLANSNFEEWRSKNPDLHYNEFPFSVDKIGSNNPMFDFIKLSDVSKNYISKYSAEQVYSEVSSWAETYDKNLHNYLINNKDTSIKAFSIDRYTAKPRKDISKWSDVKYLYSYLFTPFFTPENSEDYELADIDVNNLKLVIKKYIDIYTNYSEKDVWFSDIKTMADELGFASDNKIYKASPEKYKGNVADICAYIRLAITERKNSLDLFEICSLIGKEEVIRRLNLILSFI